MTASTPKFNAGKGWLVVLVAFFCQIVFAIGMMKVPANMVNLMMGLGINELDAGNLMNAVGIVSLILCLPAGMIMQKLGARKVMLFSLCATLIGNIVGFVAGANFGMIIAGRAIEGLGYGTQLLTVSQFITEWFPAQKRGLPQGIVSIWVAVGSFIILNTAPILPGAAEGQWGASWILAMICFVVALVLAFFILKSPTPEYMQIQPLPSEAASDAPKASIVDGLKSGATWLLMIAMLLFCFVNSSFMSYYPTYLIQDFGLDMGAANGITSVASIAQIVAGFIGGFLLNVIRTTKRIYFMFALIIVLAALGLFMYNLPDIGIAMPFCVAFGFFFQMYPGTAFAIAPESAYTPETIPTTMGIMNLASNLAGVLGTLVSSIFLVSMGSWQSLTIPNGIFAAVSIIAGIGAVFAMRKKYRQLGME